MKKKNSIDFTLYLITDRKLVTRHASRVTDYSSLITAVRKALQGGIKAVQLREKNLDTGQLLKLAYKMRTLTDQYESKLFINERTDIALAVGADGVHLPGNSIPVSAVRKLVKNKLVIGVSTHSLREAKKAEKEGADFITFGPVYRTPSKLKYGKPAGVKALKKISTSIHIPVFAIGGINQRRINDIRSAGAHGAAMIREILASEHVKEKSKELINLLGA